MSSSVDVLNLGCGTRTSEHCVNIDWSIQARLKRSSLGVCAAKLVLRGERAERFRSLTGEIVVHDLRRPLPFPDESFGAVYHSHVLEHMDRDAVPAFLAEIRRVLRVDGIHRVVVPDFEAATRRYLTHLDQCADDHANRSDHDAYIGAIIEQMVRREAFGTGMQSPVRRRIENILLGDARRRGETHQWMYDRISLENVLLAAGFRNVRVADHKSSAIPGWNSIGLDRTDAMEEYKPASLYMESAK